MKVRQYIAEIEGKSQTTPVVYNRNLAIEMYKKGADLSNDSPDEIRYYQLAIEADPTFDRPHYNLGTTYYRKGMFKEALKEFEAYLKYTNDPPQETEQVRKIVEYLKSLP